MKFLHFRMTEQWWIQKRSPGGGRPPSFFFIDQSEAQRAEKNSWETIFPPPPPTPYLMTWIRHCRKPIKGSPLRAETYVTPYCWFSHDVTKIQTTKLSILLRFFFHGVLEQLKTNFQTNFRFKRVLGFVIEYAWISKLLRDVAFTWRPRELSCMLKKGRFSGTFVILTVHALEKVLL